MPRSSRPTYLTPAVLSLAVLCTVVYLVTAWQSASLLAPLLASPVADAGELILWPMQGESWQILRALSASLLHVGPEHLLSNMVMLLLIGPAVERAYGPRLFAGLCVALAFGWAATVLWMSPTAVTVGLSGVIYGLIALVGGITVRAGGSLVPVIVLLAVSVGMSLITPGVSLWGHVGGALGGIILTTALYPVARIRDARRRIAWQWAVTALCGAGFAATMLLRISGIVAG